MGKNPIIIGDFAKYDKDLEAGVISREEYQKIFEKSRRHGLNGKIFPFAVGGSDAATIMGVSPWTSPLYLYHEKMGLIKRKISKQQEMTFFMGHVFEPVFRELFSKKSGLKTEPCTLQVVNPDYPHIVANIDGIVWENGKPGIYEGKITHPFTVTKQHFIENQVPIYYEYQVRVYMEVWNLDFAYINCGWGLDPDKEMKYLRIERDENLGKAICQACENFVLNAMMGIKPTNSICMNRSVVDKDSSILYGAADPSLPAVNIPASYAPSFAKLDRLAEQEAKMKEALKPFEKELKQVKMKMEPIERELKALEKERTEILCLFPDIIQNATTGKYTDGNNTWIVTYDPASGYSLDRSVKEYWEANFPESFKAVTSYKPNYARQLSYKKI
ncbi:YqaJ viral recombinase family protein [Anaerovoracaceae bacterium 42-11]